MDATDTSSGAAPQAQEHLELLPTADAAVPGWRGLEPAQRWDWFGQLYAAASHLDRRYRLGLRSGWWEDEVQLELLAALAAWVSMFDYASWTDPEGKARRYCSSHPSENCCAAARKHSTRTATASGSTSTCATRGAPGSRTFIQENRCEQRPTDRNLVPGPELRENRAGRRSPA